MNFAFTPDQDAFRQEVRDFIKKELPPGFKSGVGGHVETEEEWQVARRINKKMAEKGWLSIAWISSIVVIVCLLQLGRILNAVLKQR